MNKTAQRQGIKDKTPNEMIILQNEHNVSIRTNQYENDNNMNRPKQPMDSRT